MIELDAKKDDVTCLFICGVMFPKTRAILNDVGTLHLLELELKLLSETGHRAFGESLEDELAGMIFQLPNRMQTTGCGHDLGLGLHH
jgi:hypothetical protein